MARAGYELSRERTHRLWRKAGLQLPRRRARRRIATGQQIKCLTIVDEFTRECLAIDVAGSIRSRGG